MAEQTKEQQCTDDKGCGETPCICRPEYCPDCGVAIGLDAHSALCTGLPPELRDDSPDASPVESAASPAVEEAPDVEQFRVAAKELLYLLDGFRSCANQSNYGDAGDWAWRTIHVTKKFLDALNDPKLTELYGGDIEESGPVAPTIDRSENIPPADAQPTGESFLKDCVAAHYEKVHSQPTGQDDLLEQAREFREMRFQEMDAFEIEPTIEEWMADFANTVSAERVAAERREIAGELDELLENVGSKTGVERLSSYVATLPYIERLEGGESCGQAV